jgi:1-acyl-sn-glycerol-3-phosphate acyltransferase
VPLIPVYIEGTHRAWPTYNWFPRPAKIKLTFGKKITKSAVQDAYESIAEDLRKNLISLKEK